VGAHRALVAADAACAEAQRRLDEHDEHAHEVRARGDREGLTARLAGAEARRAAIATEREALRGELASADHDRQTLARSSGDLTGRIERRERTAEAAGANCEACGAPIDAEHAAREIADWRRELAVVDDRLHMLAASSAAGASRLDELAHEDGDLAGSVAETRRAIEELEALDGRRGQRQAAWAASTDVRGACASSAMAAVAAWSGAALSVDPDDLATSLGLAIASIERAVAGQRGRLDAERAAAEHRRDRAEDERDEGA
jgi:chromosome segregation ATPase